MSIKQQQTFFAPLRTLWLSLLPESEMEEHFSDALSNIPANLVTTSIFCNTFFPELSKVAKANVGTLDAERAWFGIRSIMKGGVLGTTHSNFTSNDFAQLVPIEDSKQIPRRHTNEYFTDVELRKLIEIYAKYQKWLRDEKNPRYDDLDIVIKALKAHNGEEAKLNTDKDNTYIEQIEKLKFVEFDDTGFQFCDNRIMFSTKATKKIKKLDDNSNHTVRLDNWVKDFFESQPDKIHPAKYAKLSKTRCGKSASGSDILKSRLSKSGRIFFTPLYDGDTGNIRIWVHDFTFDHDEQEEILNKLLHDGTDLNEIINALDINSEHTENNLPYDGPYKPWHQPKWKLGTLNLVADDSNLYFDRTQNDAIFGNYPVLIDGLAGTGKTSVLALRGVFRNAMSSNGTNILVTAAKSHVVQTISESMRKIKDKSTYPREFDMNYVLTNEINDKKKQSSTLKEFNAARPPGGFDEIILDECQDITYVEFELLKNMLIGHNVRRFVFAGDPLQTLNPTGFDWNRIKALFMDSNETLRPKDIEIQKFYNNYRSQGSIVEFANSIQRVRSKVLADDKSQIIMQAKMANKEIAGIVKFNLVIAGHKKAISRILKNAGSAKAIVITTAPDDAGIIELLSGKTDDGVKNDEIMYDLWNQLNDDGEPTELSDFRQKLVIHSAASVKGAEYDVVVLYKFASSKESRESLSSLIQSKDNIETAKMENKINIRYAFSKLYVALTRARLRVYLIENAEGFDFWKSINLWNADGPQDSTSFIDFENLQDPLTAVNAPNLAPSVAATKENFWEFSDNWEKYGSRNDLEWAIGLGKRMKIANTADDEILNQLLGLEGDLLTLKSKEHPKGSEAKDKFEKEGIAKYTEAGGKFLDKIVPLKYANEDYNGCLASVDSKSGEFFELVTMVCISKLGMLQASDKVEVINLVKGAYKIIPEHWSRDIVSKGRIVLKDELLSICNDVEEVCDLEDVNGKHLYNLSKLIEHYSVPSERMSIYEKRKATKQSNNYRDYFNSVKQSIEGMVDPNSMHKTFIDKEDNLLKLELEEERKTLRNFINEKLLRNLKQPNKKDQKFNLYPLLEKVSEMEIREYDSGGNEQLNGLFLAQQLISDNGNIEVDFIGKAISKFLILYNKKEEPTEDFINGLCEIIKIQTKASFVTLPCLSWWSWEKHNDGVLLVDKFLSDEWAVLRGAWVDSIKNRSFMLNQYEIDNEKKNNPKDFTHRGEMNGKTLDKHDKEFQKSFRSFHRYSLLSGYKLNNIIPELVEMANLKYNYPSLKSCISELVRNRITTKKLTLVIDERKFLVNYLDKYYRAKDKADNKLLKDLRKLKLEPEGELLDWVTRKEWELNEDAFISNYKSPRNNTINQEKLQEYIDMLVKYNFTKEAIKAKGKRTLTIEEFITTCRTMIEKEPFEKFVEYYLNAAHKGASEIEALGIILTVCDLKIIEKNLAYLVTCSEKFAKKVSNSIPFDNSEINLALILQNYFTLSFADFLNLVKDNVISQDLLDEDVDLFLNELTREMAANHRISFSFLERTKWDEETSTLGKRVDALIRIKYLS